MKVVKRRGEVLGNISGLEKPRVSKAHLRAQDTKKGTRDVRNRTGVVGDGKKDQQ